MKNYERILICTDFSENADAAFDYAVDAVRRNPGAVLYLLHVLPEPDAQFWKGYIYEADENPDENAKAALDEKIAKTYLSRLPVEIDFQPNFRIGNAAEQILAFAEEREIDLIVLGRQGASAVKRFLFGSVALKVAKSANCPVLVIPANQNN